MPLLTAPACWVPAWEPCCFPSFQCKLPDVSKLKVNFCSPCTTPDVSMEPPQKGTEPQGRDLSLSVFRKCIPVMPLDPVGASESPGGAFKIPSMARPHPQALWFQWAGVGLGAGSSKPPPSPGSPRAAGLGLSPIPPQRVWSCKCDPDGSQGTEKPALSGWKAWGTPRSMSLSINCFANTGSHESHEQGRGECLAGVRVCAGSSPFKRPVIATKDLRGEWEGVGGVEADGDSGR